MMALRPVQVQMTAFQPVAVQQVAQVAAVQQVQQVAAVQQVPVQQVAAVQQVPVRQVAVQQVQPQRTLVAVSANDVVNDLKDLKERVEELADQIEEQADTRDLERRIAQNEEAVGKLIEGHSVQLEILTKVKNRLDKLND